VDAEHGTRFLIRVGEELLMTATVSGVPSEQERAHAFNIDANPFIQDTPAAVDVVREGRTVIVDKNNIYLRLQKIDKESMYQREFGTLDTFNFQLYNA
jgi:hypothetical protein